MCSGLFLNHQDAAFQDDVARVPRGAAGARRADGRGADPTRARRSASSASSKSLAKAASGGRTWPQALLEAGHIQTIDEAFDRFIGRGGPAYFEGFRLEPAEGIRLIHSVGGFASWAHPNELDGKDWRTYLPAVVVGRGRRAGGVLREVEYCPPTVNEQLLEACAAHDLVPTVGSDFHGFGTMMAPPGSVASPPELLERLEERVERLRRSRLRPSAPSHGDRDAPRAPRAPPRPCPPARRACRCSAPRAACAGSAR